MTAEDIFVAWVTNMVPGIYDNLTDLQNMVFRETEEWQEGQIEGCILDQEYTITEDKSGGFIIVLSEGSHTRRIKDTERRIERLTIEVELLKSIQKGNESDK